MNEKQATQSYNITPVSKPRMTNSDRWRKRACVERYWDFKAQVRDLGVSVKSGDCIRFTLPMPKSWSQKKKAEMDGKPHQQKPDWDNLAKALCDAVYDDDAHLWRMTIEKVWGVEGRIEVTNHE